MMLQAVFHNMKERMAFDRNNMKSDFIAGLTIAIESIPDSMATALLAGVSPLTGLYTMMIATPVGALFSSSVMMHISVTSAIALAAGGTLSAYSPDERLGAIFMLAFLVGVIQILLAIFKMGFLVRFVPFSVMTGFLNGVAVLVILGQLGDITGFSSNQSNKVFKALDTILHAREIVLPILIIGLVTIGLIILFDRNKKLNQYSMVLAMVLASALAALPPFQEVPLVGDVTEIPNSLPHFTLPNFSMGLELFIPAIAIAVIGLVQGAGISQSIPNPDGNFPDPSGDFFGQGIANLATSFFGGMPVGGSLSGTSLILATGGKSRWANVLVGVLIAVMVLLFAGLVKLIAMPALAGLLMMIGYQTIKPANIQTVWQTGTMPRAVMIITFVGTLFMPLQFAVFLGVSISIILFISQQADRVRLVELVPVPGGFPIEQAVPRQLTSRKITILHTYGSLFYAAAKNLEENLPEVGNAQQAVVIFTMRGREELGSTMISVLDRYTRAVQKNGGKVMLSGVSESVRTQLERTGFLSLIGSENVFIAQPQWGTAVNQALEAANRWLESCVGNKEEKT